VRIRSIEKDGLHLFNRLNPIRFYSPHCIPYFRLRFAFRSRLCIHALQVKTARPRNGVDSPQILRIKAANPGTIVEAGDSHDLAQA
jgi:hypothetical protein